MRCICINKNINSFSVLSQVLRTTWQCPSTNSIIVWHFFQASWAHTFSEFVQ